MEHAVISVIVPVYNLAQELERCAVSILSQTHRELELLLIDDGSTDGSADVMERLRRADSRVRVLRQANAGVTAARLAGVRAASGDYIGFVDGDDEIEPDMYERLLAHAVRQQADIVHCGFRMVFPDGRTRLFHGSGRTVQQSAEDALRELLSGSYEPGLWCKLFRRTLFRRLLDGAMDTSIRYNEDLLMNYYLFSAAGRTVYEDVCPYHYLVRMASASHAALSGRKIFDPIRVRQIIRADCGPGLQADAERSLISCCVYTFCALTLQRGCGGERRTVRALLQAHKAGIPSLPSAKTRLLARLADRCPAVLQALYPLYAGVFQKKQYE